MKRYVLKSILLCMVMCCMVLLTKVSAATTLTPGDIFVITANASPLPSGDVVELVSRVDLTTGTKIYLSDNARTSTGSWVAIEGYITFTTSKTIPRGTIITLAGLSSAAGSQTVSPVGVGTATKNNSFDLNTTLENLFLYQGTTYNQINPTFLYGFGFGSGGTWISSGTTTSNTSYLPASLLLGQTAISLPSLGNSQYNCINTALGYPSFVTAIHDSSNWNTSTGAFAPSTCVFDFVEPTLLIDLGSGQVDITSGSTVKFAITASESINTGSFTCSDILLTGDYVSASCVSVADISMDQTVFEVIVNVGIGVSGYGDLSLTLVTGGIVDSHGVPDIGAIIDNNYIIFDTQAPVITLSGASSLTVESGMPWIEPGVTCIDNFDSSCVVVSSGSVNTAVLGTYLIQYSATDDVGNTSTETRTIEVVDTTPPTEPVVHINIDAPYTVNTPEITITGSTDLHFSGYMIAIDGSLFTIATGTYYPTLSGDTHTIIVRAYDTSGNYSEKTMYYPPVVNIIAPTVLSNTGIADTIIQITSASGDIITNVVFSGAGNSGFSCGILPALAPVTCTGGIISTSGVFEVIATNGAFTGSSTQSYIVDTNSPIVVLNGSGTLMLPRGVSYSEAGAMWTDDVDGSGLITSPTILSGPNMGWIDSYGIPGTYILEYTYIDTAGNIGSAIRTVIVSVPLIPSPHDDFYTINQDTILDVSDGSHALNDSGMQYVMSGYAVVNPTHGSYIITGMGFIYTPHTGYVGTDIMVYALCNILNQCNNATITITIQSTVTTGSVIIGPITGFAGGGMGDSVGNHNTKPLVDKEDIIDREEDIFNSSIGDICYTPGTMKTIYEGNNVSNQFRIAHQMLYSYGLTKWKGTKDYRPEDHLTREEVAKFMVEFAEKVLCRKPSRVYMNNFSDIEEGDPTLISYIQKSYEYGIFKGGPDGRFRPTEGIKRDELIAIIVRLVTNSMLYEGGEDWANEYKEKYKILGGYPIDTAVRGEVAEGIYSLYKYNSYILQNDGYVLH